jgi:hypothetical protein
VVLVGFIIVIIPMIIIGAILGLGTPPPQ